MPRRNHRREAQQQGKRVKKQALFHTSLGGAELVRWGSATRERRKAA